MADDLGKLRAEIDRIDGELLALIEARQSVAAQVAGTKPPGSPVFRPAREAYLLASLLDRAAPANSQLVKRVWRQLLSASVARQKPDFTVLAPQQLSLQPAIWQPGFSSFALTDDSAAALARLAAGEGDLALLDADSLAGLAAEISNLVRSGLSGGLRIYFCSPVCRQMRMKPVWQSGRFNRGFICTCGAIRLSRRAVRGTFAGPYRS